MTANPQVNRAIEWLRKPNGDNFLTDEQHCPMRDIFQARLDKTRILLEKEYGRKDLVYLLVAVVGEIGNNAFDHNLGAWRDVPGVYFVHDSELKTVVIADRGQGIFKTIKKVKPEARDDLDALKIAFTETISGRAPEKRGNGLKFVAKIAAGHPVAVELWSGAGRAVVNSKNGLQITESSDIIDGTLGVASYNIK